MNHRSQLSVQRSISLYNTRTHACTRPPRSVSPCPHCIVPIVMSRSRLVKPRSHRTNWTELNEATRLQQASIDNESVPKIIINNAINLSYKTAISILLISNHNSLRVLFDRNWFRVFYLKIYLYFIIGNGQPREPALCQLYRHTFVPYGEGHFRRHVSRRTQVASTLCSQSYSQLMV